MSTIRKFVHAALLAATAVHFMPGTSLAQEPAHGKFTLSHDVLWSNAKVPAGDYEYSYDPYQTKPVLTLSKLDGPRAGFMLLVTATSDSKPTDSNQLLLETSPEGSYVSKMQLADCGLTLYFPVPVHSAKAMARSVATAASLRR
jgi:hypothetical protein